MPLEGRDLTGRGPLFFGGQAIAEVFAPSLAGYCLPACRLLC